MRDTISTITKCKYSQISELGSMFNLSFSSYLELGKKVIALDGVKRSLLVFETSRGSKKPFIIELSKVMAVTVKNCYSSRATKSKANGDGEFLRSIDLEFKYGRNGTITISFYDSETDKVSDLSKLERNAWNWQLILSKMIRDS